MRIFIKNKTRFKIKPSLFRKALENVPKTKKVQGDLSVVIVSDKEIKRINKLHRGKNKRTDVLAFNFFNSRKDFPKMKEDVIGEIFISARRAKEQAKELGHSFKKECLLLFIHGLLHIFGYDHQNKREALLMKKKEVKILSKII